MTGPQEARLHQEAQPREAARPLPGEVGEQELQQLQSLRSISSHPGVFHPRQVSSGGCVPIVSAELPTLREQLWRLPSISRHPGAFYLKQVSAERISCSYC